jgi:hypothetical protein
MISLVVPKTAHAVIATLVQVVNTSANPVTTQVVNNPARQAVVLTALVIVGDGQTMSEGTFQAVSGEDYVVPAGMRLVIESTSGIIVLPTGQKLFRFGSYVSVNQVQGTIYAVPTFVTSADGNDFYEWLTQATTYTDPGHPLGVDCVRYPYNVGTATCRATLSGHLESIN